MKSYEELEMIFGRNCDQMKIADALFDGIERYSVNGETGETITDGEFWDWISTREGVPV